MCALSKPDEHLKRKGNGVLVEKEVLPHIEELCDNLKAGSATMNHGDSDKKS